MVVSSAKWLVTLFCPIVGVVLSNLIWVAPLPAIGKVRSGLLTEVTVFPYGCMVLNCMSWVFYGCVNRNYFLFTANYFGLLLGLFYSVSYAVHEKAHKPDRSLSAAATTMLHYMPTHTEMFLIGSTAMWALIGMLVGSLTYPAVSQQTPQPQVAANLYLAIGIISCACNIIFYISPLSTMLTVISTQSADSMNLPLCITIFMNSAFWTVYAAVGVNDIFVLIPNAMGLVVALVELILVMIYPTLVPSPKDGEGVDKEPNDVGIDSERQESAISTGIATRIHQPEEAKNQEDLREDDVDLLV